MIHIGMDVVRWVVAVAVLVALASWWAHRSYRQFLQQARGQDSTALPPQPSATPLDLLLEPLQQAHPDQSGLLSLLNNHEAFAARTLSAAQSGRSLDLMYYIWSADLTGWLLIKALVEAADRGVRVRLLLDDVNVQGYDRTFLALSQHPKIEVRLFNPTRHRGHVFRRALEMALGLSRFNRRMHGKLWIVDGRLAIIGGRNIGDTYFGAHEGNRVSIDADVALIGAKVAEVSSVFDSYWNLGLSLPIRALWPAFKVSSPAFRKRLIRRTQTAAAQTFYGKCVGGRSAGVVLTERLRWTDKVTLLADPPDKAYGEHSAPWISTAIATILASAQQEVRLITPYFVPGRAGIAGLIQLAKRGVRVSLLTNALSSTDMVLVYGAYRHYRGPLLAAGARCFEFSKPATPGRRREVLHSKVFVIDGTQVLLGSPNFDMRSAYTNTELGLLMEEPGVVAEVSQMFDTLSAPPAAYEVTQHGHRLEWLVHRPGLPATMGVEPEANWSRRAISWIVGHLPIQSYL